MDFIVPLYLFSGFFAIAISVPSIIQLIKTKKSDELSLLSWSGWLAYQIIALFYGLYINAVAYTVINMLWIAFYMIMIVLIVTYRPARRAKRKAKAKNRRKKIIL